MSGFRFPNRVVLLSCAMTRENPAHIGAERLVPPMQHFMVAVPLTSWPQKTPGELGLAIREISGTSRAASFGTPEPT
jgi:hypothetical protein